MKIRHQSVRIASKVVPTRVFPITEGQASAGEVARGFGELPGQLARIGMDIVNKFETQYQVPHFKAMAGPSATADNTFGHFATVPSGLLPRALTFYKEVRQFVEERIIPKEKELMVHATNPATAWTINPQIEKWKSEARSMGLWNLFVPASIDAKGAYGPRLTNVEYAHVCELMGRSVFAPEVFNCSAPDTGNMEVLLKYGTDEQKDTWLKPLLEGDIRSCFAMTEPDVASSDATNMQCQISRSGDSHYTVNGKKWYISGAADPRCKLAIVLGRSATDETQPDRHRQHSMVLVPMDAPGVRVGRPLHVLGMLDAPGGHCEVTFDNVRVPETNIILYEGAGFAVAQGRLGPGRIHHCMRLIGHCERALALMKQRVLTRRAFGRTLSEMGSIREDIARSRVEIEQARLLVLKTAHMIDVLGAKRAALEISLIKACVPSMTMTVLDRCMQAHGALGLSQDTPMAAMYAWARALRLADGPDEVHLESIARKELRARL